MGPQGLTLLLGIALWLFSIPGAWAIAPTRELAFRENFYDVEFRGKLAWIVGYYGTVLHSRDGGLSWQVQSSGTEEALFRVVFVDPQRGWISGSYGTLLHTRNGGKSWEIQKTSTTEHLFGLTFLNERKGWVVGSRGTILYTEDGGATWLSRSLNKDVLLNDVAFIDSSVGWVVGEFGRIYRTNDAGESWVKQKSPVEVSFISGENRNFFRLLLLTDEADGKSLRNGWAFGLDGLILRTKEGDHWEVVPKNGSTGSLATTRHLFDAVVFRGKKWAVGERGTVVFARLGDEKWSHAELDAPPISLNAIAFASDGLGLIAGNRGILLRTEDGGKRWNSIRIVSQGPGRGIIRVQ